MLSPKPGLSATKVLVSLGIVFSSTMMSAGQAYAACQAGQPGCVLPVGEPAPPPLPPPPAAAPAPVIYEEEGGGISLWLILLGLVAAAAAIYFLVIDDDDEDAPISP